MRGMRTPWVTLMERGVWTEGEQEGQAGSGKSRLHLLLWRYRHQAHLLSPLHMPGVGHASLQPQQHCGKVTKRSGHSRGEDIGALRSLLWGCEGDRGKAKRGPCPGSRGRGPTTARRDNYPWGTKEARGTPGFPSWVTR